MNKGDRVRVWPHGHENEAAVGEVILVSVNQLSIAVAFGDKPPFAVVRAGMLLHPGHGVVMLARRESSDGQPIGPWIELVDGGHYEIEPQV